MRLREVLSYHFHKPVGQDAQRTRPAAEALSAHDETKLFHIPFSDYAKLPR
jgi:hypothetical protein